MSEPGGVAICQVLQCINNFGLMECVRQACHVLWYATESLPEQAVCLPEQAVVVVRLLKCASKAG